MILVLPLLIALVGLLVYILCQNGKVAELGRLMFAIGLLAFLLKSSEGMLKIVG